MEQQLRQFIEQSKEILITSHISPDPDAICSSLLLAQAIQLNYPEKEVIVNLEELPEGLEFINGFERVRTKSLGEALNSNSPDLLIIVDANSFARCTRNDAQAVKKHISGRTGRIKTIIIDHHEPEGRDKVDLFISEISPATAQIVYILLFEKLGLKKPKGYAEITLLGIISDTSRFLHDNPSHRETFRIVSDLLDAGASIEVLTNRQSRYTLNQMAVFAELARNVAVEDDYAYTFVSDKFKNEWVAAGKSPQELKNGAEIFVSDYLRNIDDKLWGFVAYPELLGEVNMYGVSLRAVSGARDVSVIARKLGGGGHKPAAGAKIKADNIKEAVDKVRTVIEP